MARDKRRIRSRRRAPELETGAAADTAERATSDGSRTSPIDPYPKGAAMRATATHVVLWSVVGLSALGGVGFIWNMAAPQPEAVAVQEQTFEIDPYLQPASAFALSYTTAWLTASKDDATQLESFVRLQSAADLSPEPWQYEDATVASVVAEGDGLYAVLVEVWVLEKEAPEDEEEQAEGEWLRRGFRTLVQVAEDGMTPIGFPAPVALPGNAGTVTLDYTSQLTEQDPAGAAIRSFLEAYAAGGGDNLDRFTSPEAEIAPITPAPYTSVLLRSLYAAAEVMEAPSDGSAVDVYADVVFTAADGRSVPATYLLSLEARAGRWEVRAIDAAPNVAAQRESHPLPSVSPSEQGDEPSSEPSSSSTPTPTL